jgi:hypothetical protein
MDEDKSDLSRHKSSIKEGSKNNFSPFKINTYNEEDAVFENDPKLDVNNTHNMSVNEYL